MADSGSERLLALLGDTGGGLELVRRICELCVTELAVSGAGVSVIGGPLSDGSQVLLHATDDVWPWHRDLAPVRHR